MQGLVGTDLTFDRNADGRFNQADVDSLAAIVGTPDASDPGELLVWDFNGDGVIDEEDVEKVQFAIDAGVGAGILGDLDQDSDADCDDFDLLPASPNYTIGDNDYLAQLDADLDGDNDAADLNGDQSWDFYDVQTWLGWVSAACS